MAEGGRSAIDVVREAQQLLYSSGGPERQRVIAELDQIAAALAVLPDLHAQLTRRYAVLFPSEVELR